MSGARDAALNDAALLRLRGAFSERIARGDLPGVVYRIERRGVLAESVALGQQDPTRALPMREDSIFRIYSMTKPVVSVAVMMLAEQGRLMLSDRLDRHLPAFAQTKVGVARGEVLVLEAPRRPITVYELLRHTAGLTYEWHEPSPVRQRYAEADLDSRARTNAEHVQRIAALPLQHQPGAVWDYSRATDVLGHLIEAVTGTPLGAHLQASLFEPLGMVDTGFAPGAAQHPRLAEPFARAGQAPALFDAHAPAALHSGGGGLWSTAADYGRFLRLLAGGGRVGGVRLLGPRSVEHLTCDHLGPLPRAGDVLPPGHGFGLGVAVKTAPGQASEPGSVGSYGWSGAGGTAFFVDPAQALWAVVLTQAPERFDEVRELFRFMVYAALDD
jgi:CubicO group peptidase (beta-lactamase class C family)